MATTRNKNLDHGFYLPTVYEISLEFFNFFPHKSLRETESRIVILEKYLYRQYQFGTLTNPVYERILVFLWIIVGLRIICRPTVKICLDKRQCSL